MKKRVHIGEKLLRKAREACSATTFTETIRLDLQALVRYAAYEPAHPACNGTIW